MDVSSQEAREALGLTFVDKKPRTYVQATDKGRDAFAGHVAALKEILQHANDPTQTPATRTP